MTLPCLSTHVSRYSEFQRLGVSHSRIHDPEELFSSDKRDWIVREAVTSLVATQTICPKVLCAAVDQGLDHIASIVSGRAFGSFGGVFRSLGRRGYEETWKNSFVE